MNQKSSEWLKYVQKTMNESCFGRFLAKDTLGRTVILEWEKATVKEPAHAKNMNEICEVACQAYTEVEVRFLKQFPDIVQSDQYYKSFEPFFANGVKHVDWSLVEKEMNDRIKQIHQMDYSQLNAEDLYFFVKVRDRRTNKLLGFTIFLIKSEYSYGTVKDISIGLMPEVQGYGLGKLLISSVFKIIPNVDRIFLFTRITNNRAIGAYRAWGFVKDLHPVQDPYFTFKKEHWVSLQYNAKRSHILQETVENFKDIQ